jgi:hypothetical protein
VVWGKPAPQIPSPNGGLLLQILITLRFQAGLDYGLLESEYTVCYVTTATPSVIVVRHWNARAVGNVTGGNALPVRKAVVAM